MATYKKKPVGRPLKFKTPEELQNKCDAFFLHCLEVEEIPTITGLAVFLDTDRITLIQYEGRPEFTNTIRKAKAKVTALLHQFALQNKANTAISIFSLKNNHGWDDEFKHQTESSVHLSFDDEMKTANKYFDDRTE